MRGKAALWLGNLILIALVAANSQNELGLGPFVAGLAVLSVYSVILALKGAQRTEDLLNARVSDLPRDVDLPLVSILVPAKNEARVIRTTLEGLLRLDYASGGRRRYEIIAIDDASTDGTGDAVQEVADRNPDLRLLRRQRGTIPGKSAALNDALRSARGEIVAVFDGDARVAPDFLRRALPRLLPEEVGAVQAQKRMSNVKRWRGGRISSLSAILHRSFFLPLLQDVEMLMDTAYQSARGHGRGAVDLRGNGLLVKRRALLTVGGWNNDTLTDDLDLSTRLHVAGWQVAFCPEAVVWEEGVLTWRALFRQRRRWVEGFIRRYLDYGDQLLSAPIARMLKIDTLLFATELVLPMWLFFGVIIGALERLVGVPYDITVSVAIALGAVAVTLPFILVVVWRNVTHDLRRYPFVILAVSIYLLHWVPVIIWTVLRLVALRPQRTWAKTEHVGELG